RLVHAVQVDRHQQRADLVIRNASARDSADEEVDLVARKALTVSVLSYDVLWSQAAFLSCSPSAQRPEPLPRTLVRPHRVLHRFWLLYSRTPHRSLTRRRCSRAWCRRTCGSLVLQARLW